MRQIYMCASNARSAVLLTSTFVLCALTGCYHRDISAGTFHGLTIGMDKADTFLAARNLGATLATAIPCGYVVRRDNLDQLPWLDHAEGVRVSESGRQFIVGYFSGDRIVKIYAPQNVDQDFAQLFSIGDDRSTVRVAVRNAISTRANTYAHPIIQHDALDSVHLDAILPDATRASALRDCWNFQVTTVKPAGAYYELTFKQNGLVKVSYTRPWIRE
jgi:hypothetical protein